MDYLIANAKEIMMLCFGFGFLVLVFFVVRVIYLATRLLKKVDDLADLTIHYINRPLSMLVSVEKAVNRFLGGLGK